MRLYHKRNALLAAALRQLLELLHPQRHSKVGHWHGVAVNWQGEGGREGEEWSAGWTAELNRRAGATGEAANVPPCCRQGATQRWQPGPLARPPPRPRTFVVAGCRRVAID